MNAVMNWVQASKMAAPLCERAHRNPVVLFGGLVVCTVLLAVPVRAHTHQRLEVIGLSQDGKYLAFEQYCGGDESGRVRASVTCVDVAANAWVGTPFTSEAEISGTSQDDEEIAVAKARRNARARAKEKLARLGVKPGNTGVLSASHRLTDDTEMTGAVRFKRDSESAREPLCELLLEPRKYELPLGTGPAPDQDVMVFRLTLVNLRLAERKVLHDDYVLPRSRGRPMEYRITDVFMYKTFIAVFLAVYSQGFEGQDVTYMVVTGVLN